MQHPEHGALALGLLFLTACGGGGGVSPTVSTAIPPAPAVRPPSVPVAPSYPDIPWLVDPASARATTGGSAPTTTDPAQIGAEHETLQAAADTLLATNVYVRGSGAVGDISTVCRGDTCNTEFGPASIGDNDFSLIEYQPVMTKNGIQMIQNREESTDADGTLSSFGYGAWMNYSGLFRRCRAY